MNKLNSKLFASIVFILFGFYITEAQEDFNFAELLPEKFDKANIIEEEDYNVWGTNILKGNDGKYHAIYSRWPKSRGHLGWVTHSEIAHAVSENLTGPYKFKNLVLPPRGNKYWDGDCTHNPHVIEHDGKYYLYHMGNRGSGYWNKTPDNRKPSYNDDEWWVNRNNQRIGIAVTNDLNGEWERFDKPLIDVTNGRWMTSTPTVTRRNDGKFLMAYKYVEAHPKFKNGKVVHVTATSRSPLGPFEDTNIPFITHPTASFAIDDHVEWVYNGNYYCIAKDSRGAWSDYTDGSTMLFEGDDMGLNWKPSKNFLVIKAGEIKWTDGTVTKTTRTADMPKFYMENGIPKALIIAVLPENSEDSFSVVIPLKTPMPKTKAFPYQVTEYSDDYKLSAALNRSFNQYPSHVNAENELYSQFKYTKLTGLDYNDGDATVTRRDPSKVLFEDGKYYVWYTKRHTPIPPVGKFSKDYKIMETEGDKIVWNDTIPTTDWDLAEVWYATSKDGFHWEEQGVAVTRPEYPIPGWRAVATPDILKFEGKYYIYYQAFTEPSGVRGDYCPVGVAYADNINGPWTHVNDVVIPTGAKGEWDQFAIQAPTPLVHNGQIYVYYKAAFNRPGTVWSGIGLAIADNPLGPFKKHELNPVQNSGHEICFFPWKEGVASLTIRDGSEHFTIQYAKDWVNFDVMAITEFMPTGPNAYIPDAFLDNKDGRGITWGIGHFINFKGKNAKRTHSELYRFDCDLSLDVHDPEMKYHNYRLAPQFYFNLGLSDKQKKRIKEENQKVKANN
ncbi:family 43 glycosylhydrolase [Seonamhaeicola maritimus]|uniref:family 43 glycosylhydrolase n=1 Tax=Seonamhaeicola maritimus TaxID=2591822 RepID=UPI002494E4AF|nr:family 43 glycosylhydrolase [Seonamhaeicola maritimus]